MKNLVALLAAAASTLAADLFAVPACPDPFEAKQSDGTVVTLHKRGDEFLKWHEDAEGYSVVRDAQDGDWWYAEVSADGATLVPSALRVGEAAKARPSAKHLVPPLRQQKARQAKAVRLQADSSRAVSHLRPTGTAKQLVVLVQFSDLALKKTKQEFDDLFNKVGYGKDGNMGSVRDFYREISYGKLDVQSTVVGPVTLSKSYWNYYGAGDDENVPQMGIDVVDALHSQGFDFSPYDADGDGWMDELDIIHAGWGEEYGDNSADNIWSARWSWRSPYYFASYDGVKFGGFHTEPELRGSDTSTSHKITQVGVICHEFGHSLGLPDLYDTDYTSEGVGDFCLMSGGSWGRYGNGDSGTCPAPMSAWCKKQLGWVTPTEITASGLYSLARAEDSDKVYKLHGNFTSDKEYFLIENKTATGFGRGLPGANKGLLIWHVDENRPDNTDESHYMVDLEEASGTQHLEVGGCGRGNDDDYFRSSTRSSFTSTTTPNNKSYSGTALGLDITGISASGGTMTFTVTGASGPEPDPLPDAPEIFVSTWGDTHANADYVEILWDPVAGATSYSVFRSETTVRPSTPIARNATSPYRDLRAASGLVPGKKYHYWVSASNAAGESFSASDWGNILVSLALSPASVTFGENGGMATVTVTANAPWTVVDTNSWVSVSTPDGRDGNGRVVVTAAQNTSQTERTGMLQIVAGATTSYPSTKTVALKQSAAAPQPPPEFVVENNVLVGYNGAGGVVTIPANVGGQTVREIGANVFKANLTLTKVVFPASVVKIGENAFEGCTALEIADFGQCDKLAEIGGWSFENSGLRSADLPDSVTKIGTSAFFGCRNLAEVSLGSGLKTIMYGAFYGCGKLEAVVIPDSVTDMDTGHTFYSCTALKAVTIGSGLKTIPKNCFYGCTSLGRVTVPPTVETIGFRAFYGCKALDDVTIGQGVKTVGENAFDSCTALVEITLPASVTAIGNYAFIACASLVKVNYLGNAPSVQPGIYRKTPNTLVSAVTAESTGWNGSPGSTALPDVFPVDGNEDARAIMRPGNWPVKATLSVRTRGDDARDDYIEICWDAIPGESYNLYRSTTTDRPADPVRTGVTPNYRDALANGLVGGTVYYYWVESVTSLGSEVSDPEWGNIRKQAELPDAPTLTAAEGTEDGVILRWTPADGAEAYRVYRSTASMSRGEPIAEGVTDVLHVDTTGAPGVDYWYSVAAVNGEGSTCGNALSAYRKPSISPVSGVRSFAAEGGSSSVAVSANAGWTVSSSASWLTLNSSGGEGEGRVTATASANESPDSRSADVEFVCAGDTAHAVTKTLTFTQSGAPLGPEPGSDTISNLSLMRFWPSVDAQTYATAECRFTLNLPEDVESSALEFRVTDADYETDVSEKCFMYVWNATGESWDYVSGESEFAAGEQVIRIDYSPESGSRAVKVAVRIPEGEWIETPPVRLQSDSYSVWATGVESCYDGETVCQVDTSGCANGLYDAQFKPWDEGTSEGVQVYVFNSELIVCEEGRVETNVFWSAERAHVLRGDVVVPPGVTLTIANGAAVRRFSVDSRIFVQPGGRVRLEGVRFERVDLETSNLDDPPDYLESASDFVVESDEDGYEVAYREIAGTVAGRDEYQEDEFRFSYAYTTGERVRELPVPDYEVAGCAFAGWQFLDGNEYVIVSADDDVSMFGDIPFDVSVEAKWMPNVPTGIYAITSGTGIGGDEVGWKVVIRWSPVPGDNIECYRVKLFREGQEGPDEECDEVPQPTADETVEYVCDDVPSTWGLFGGETVFCRVQAVTTEGEAGAPLEFSFALPLVLTLERDVVDDEQAPAEGGNVVVGVTANVKWEASTPNGDWIHLENNPDDPGNLYFTVDPTVTESERLGVVRVTGGGTTRTLTVVQAGDRDRKVKADKPVIDPPDGTAFEGDSCTVTLSCATEGADIYYTTDGTTPDASSGTMYVGPFSVVESVEIRAISVKDGLLDSDVALSRITKLANALDDFVEIEVGGLPMRIPKAWLELYYPELVGRPLADYAAKALSATVKDLHAPGTAFVWQDYVAGTVPTNPASVFKVSSFKCANGEIEISWDPDMGDERTYVLYGNSGLDKDGWTPTTKENAGTYNFFKVTVDLKTGQ